MEIERISFLSSENVMSSEDIRKAARQYEKKGIKPRDALHIACAVKSNADYFLSCDDKVVRKADVLGENLKIVNPVDFIREVKVN